MQPNELARRDQGGLEIRDEAMRVRIMLAGLNSADGHDLSCTFLASVRAVPDHVERQMLAEVLLAERAVLTADDVAAHFLQTLQPAAADVAEQFAVEDFLAAKGEARSALLDKLKSAATSVAFACGLEVLPPFSLEFASGSFQKQRLRSMQQSLIEQQRAGEIEHLERAADLLKRFEAIRRSTPELSAGRVLDQISPADRGTMLRTLLLASSRGPAAAPPQPLWAVAGPYLAKIDSADPSHKPELLSLPTDLGPLRSVQSADIDGSPALLVGAQRGFFLLHLNDLAKPTPFVLSSESALGFNRILYWSARKSFCGTHGEAGLVRWDAQNGAAPAAVIAPNALGAPSAGPRHLQRLDDQRVIFSAGPKLFSWDGETLETIPSGPNADIVGIVPEIDSLIVVRDDGTIHRLDRGLPHEMQTLQKRPSRVLAAGALPWMDDQRLLLSSEDGAVSCIGLEDQLVTEYLSAHRGLRAVAGSPGLVAAASPDRQRIILWNAWDGQRPLTEIYLAALTRHRIADISFG
jgi:hypothetical protein